MKITFFESEDTVHPRISYLQERGTWLSAPFPVWKIAERVGILFTVLVAVSLVLYFRYVVNQPDFGAADIAAILILWLLYLPLHEFSHVLFYVLAGYGVDTVRFFPDVRSKKPLFQRLGGSVYTLLAAFSRAEVVMGRLFPLLLLTVLLLVLCLALPEHQPALFLLAITNLGGSSYDICYAAAALLMPRGAVWIGGAWYQPADDAPFVICRFRLTPDHKAVQYQAFRFARRKATERRGIPAWRGFPTWRGCTAEEIPTPPLSAPGRVLIEEFKTQFHL
ncbi:MAG: DUF3267 domain-containing protein [Clostridia bacterium]|nr:DUF3267 domain-containing protein [Clostridia bacterium]